MPAAGRKPVDGPKRNRSKPVHDWMLVADIPYDGPRPELPKQTLVGGRRSGLLQATKDWWDTVSTMPHCVLWGPSDWLFALETVYVVEAVFRGDMPRAAELRQRSKILGTTVDARRDLRIRYVDPEQLEGDDRTPAKTKKKATSATGNVTSIEARRRRLTDAS